MWESPYRSHCTVQQLKSFWTLFKLRWKSKTVHLTWYAYLALSMYRPAHAVEKVSYQIRYILYVVQNWIMHSCPLLPYSFHQDSQSSLSLTLSGPLFPALGPEFGRKLWTKMTIYDKVGHWDWIEWVGTDECFINRADQYPVILNAVTP